jgi:hypothetical protein
MREVSRKQIVTAPGKPPETPLKRRIIRGFWQNFPYEEPNFYSRDAWIAIPGAPGRVNIDQFTVPANQVILFTDICFRTKVNLLGGMSTLARDDFFSSGTTTLAVWNLTIAGGGVMQRFLVDPTQVTGDYVYLNQNILPANINAALVAREGEVVNVDSVLTANALILGAVALGVEYRGVQLNTNEYDRLVSEFGG